MVGRRAIFYRVAPWNATLLSYGMDRPMFEH